MTLFCTLQEVDICLLDLAIPIVGLHLSPALAGNFPTGVPLHHGIPMV